MSSDKTKCLGLNKWVGSDQVLRSEFNENFDKIDAYVDDSLAVKTTSVQLKQGLQVIDVNQSSPLNNVTIQGRTLVNLLGRDGNCEDAGRFTTYQSTVSNDTIKYIKGNKSLKIISSIAGIAQAATRNSVDLLVGRYYLIRGWVYNESSPSTRLYFGGSAQYAETLIQGKWVFLFRKFSPTTAVTASQAAVQLQSTTVNQVAYADELAIYEITQAEYSAIDSMTPERIAAKWPYVDDMKSVYSPYVIKYGENLLPPFAEWKQNNGGIQSITDPYCFDTTVNGNYQGLFVDVPVAPGTQYTLRINVSSGGLVAVSRVKSDGTIGSDYTNTVLVPAVNGVATLPFTADNDAQYVKIGLTSGQAISGSFTFADPMLNVGSEARPFKPYNDDHLFFPNVQLASNVDGTIHDTLFQRDGKYWKQARFKTMDLTGDLDWIGFSNKYTGYRRVYLAIGPNVIYGSQKVVKFDGKILGPIGAIDSAQLNSDGNLFLDIAVTDSGWGDSYTNLSVEEIKAYFYGWKMNNGTFGQAYNNTGTRTWTAWYAQDNNQAPTIVPTSIALAPNGARYTPYRLQYQLAATTIEEIASEGGITLHEGANQFEVGTGMIVRENVHPFVFSGKAHINNSAPGGASNILRKRVGKITRAHKDSLTDGWTISKLPTNDPSYPMLGAEVAWISEANFANAAAYTVTYLALDQHAISCNVHSIQFEHAGNMKSVVDTLAAGHADMAARVGALEITRAQRVQPQWIRPTLLNGWTNFGPSDASAGYYLDEFSIVRIQGLIKPGDTARGTVILQLPASYRPSHIRRFTVPALGDGVFSFADLFVSSRGELRIDAVPKGVAWVSLDTISFSLF